MTLRNAWPGRLLVVALFLTPALIGGFAQGNQQYLALLDGYARGQGIQAVQALSAWPEDRVRAAVQTLDRRAAFDRALAAMMLHTDAAFDEPADGRESFHVGVARSFLQRLGEEPADAAAKRTGRLTAQGVRELSARWHALIGILYCVRDDDRRARLEVNRGLALDSNHKDVNLVAGALVEHLNHREVSNQRGKTSGFVRFLEVITTYRRILSNHPDYLEARLRLGWVLHLNNSHENSREQLEQVAAGATSGELRYLAHLFLGSVHERANRLSEAAREYDSARAVAPFQSSVIALMRVEAALGHDDRARALAADIPAAGYPDAVDPWHSYNMCFTGGRLLEGLRAEAQRP